MSPTILNGRSLGEVRGAVVRGRLQARAWTIPGEPMKIGKEHRVPLSNRAVACSAPCPVSTALSFFSYPVAAHSPT